MRNMPTALNRLQRILTILNSILGNLSFWTPSLPEVVLSNRPQKWLKSFSTVLVLMS